ncbi:hypothetical protein D6D18_03902 [Aureobasidium pullulans]|nr:hypothetical protein D6D28_00402 [Aureobasidium pullulans]THV82111.1 hypothetical protein D6D26_10284 [Aureobasidium pullulans]THV87769.1 hypothetical protein D6D29_00492 [Aureobasidium pullulans]THX02922.1 hypothetical protein D6D18_03902 [Aureobasidium pullulans]
MIILSLLISYLKRFSITQLNYQSSPSNSNPPLPHYITMSGTEQTFHYTKEDVRKMEQRDSAAHGGNVTADSNASAMQSIVDQADKNKAELIEERRSNLPKPEDPPVKSDFNSADPSTVNVGSGAISGGFSVGNDALREPATGDSAVRTDGAAYGVNTLGQGVGREGKDGLNGLPNDAVAREAKGKSNLADTTGKDYGYPKNDPSNAS